jgi:hypothetical protein
MDTHQIVEASCHTCQSLSVVTDGFCLSRCPTCQPPTLEEGTRCEPVRDDRPWPRTCEECERLLDPHESWTCLWCATGAEPCHGCGEPIEAGLGMCDACWTRDDEESPADA